MSGIGVSPPNPDSTIHVVAAVLRDERGRLLLTQRLPHTDHAGCWEFPGGKIDPGEDAEAALRRELHEELGIAIGAAHALHRVPWSYGARHIVLHAFEVDSFAGAPHGREGQAIQWCEPERLHALAMPAADIPIVSALRLPRTLAISPEPAAGGDWLAQFERCAAQGARLIQLRAKCLDSIALRALAARCVDLAHRHGARLVLNDAIDIARETGADGVHLSARATSALHQRPLPPTAIVGASCHDRTELARALALRVDYVVLGPVRETASHPGRAAMGWESFADLVRDCAVPCFALGGVTIDDLPRVRHCGGFGVAGIRAFWPHAG